MKKRSREYIMIIAITCMSWGFFFPEYTFTADSYRLLMQEETALAKPYEGMNADAMDNADEVSDVKAAVYEGRVKYRLRFAEYIKDLIF